MYTFLGTLLIINVPLGLILFFYFRNQPEGKKAKTDEGASAALKNLQSQFSAVTELVERTSLRLNNYLGNSTLGNRRITEFIENFEKSTAKLTSLEVSLDEAHSLVECLDEISGQLEAFDRGEILPEQKPDEDSSRETSSTAPGVPSSADTGGTSGDALNDDFRKSIEELGKSDDWSANRSSERKDIAFAVSALPLDEEQHLLGDRFEGLAREVSTGGMSFCHTEPIEAPLLALELRCEETAPIYVLMEVRRTESFGPYLISGGRFLSRLKSPRLIKLLKTGCQELELQPA